MTKTVALAMFILLAACSGGIGGKTEKKSANLVLDADLATGKLMLTCRDSSSGTCHVLVAGGNGVAVRLSAAKGAMAEGEGALEGARYCAGPAAPENGCNLTALRDGEQIYRSSEVKTERD